MGDRARGTLLRLRARVRAGHGHSRGSWSGGRARQWRLGVIWATGESPEAQDPSMTNFATLAKFLPELNPSADKKIKNKNKNLI